MQQLTGMPVLCGNITNQRLWSRTPRDFYGFSVECRSAASPCSASAGHTQATGLNARRSSASIKVIFVVSRLGLAILSTGAMDSSAELLAGSMLPAGPPHLDRHSSTSASASQDTSKISVNMLTHGRRDSYELILASLRVFVQVKDGLQNPVRIQKRKQTF